MHFEPAPILLGFVLGPRFEENFQRSLLLSNGDLWTFVSHPVSACFLGAAVLLIVAQVYVRLVRRPRSPIAIPFDAFE